MNNICESRRVLWAVQKMQTVYVVLLQVANIYNNVCKPTKKRKSAVPVEKKNCHHQCKYKANGASCQATSARANYAGKL